MKNWKTWVPITAALALAAILIKVSGWNYFVHKVPMLLAKEWSIDILALISTTIYCVILFRFVKGWKKQLWTTVGLSLLLLMGTTIVLDGLPPSPWFAARMVSELILSGIMVAVFWASNSLQQ